MTHLMNRRRISPNEHMNAESIQFKASQQLGIKIRIYKLPNSRNAMQLDRSNTPFT